LLDQREEDREDKEEEESYMTDIQIEDKKTKIKR